MNKLFTGEVNIVKGHSMELNMIKHKNFALTTMIGLQQSLIKP